MKFKNKITGIIEDVTNPALIPQYQKYNDTYEVVETEVEVETEAEVEVETEANTKAPKSRKKSK